MNESWDGIVKMGCVAVRIDRQGTISQDMVHLKGTGLPTIPYIINSREVEEEGLLELELPSSWQLKEAIYNLFSGAMGPHLKSSMDKLREALRGDWRKEKLARYTFPKLVAEGDDDDDGDARTGGTR